MKWRFWRKNEVQNQHAKLLVKLEAKLDGLSSEMHTLNESVTDVSEQITKLTRLQFKTSKDTADKFEQFQRILNTRENDDSHKDKNFLVQSIIGFVDDLDHICSGIHDRDATWLQLLTQWSNEMINQLKQIGIFELVVMGKSFDPSVAEAIKVVHKETLSTPPVVPYQIVEVVKRGFTDKNGQVLRKAQVITVKESL